MPEGVGTLRTVAVEIPEATIDDLIRRLRRVEGQIRGIQQMLVDGRECRDVVTQISAASKALDQAGFKLVASGLTYCLTHPEEAADAGYDIDDVQKMFMKLA
jgi:DNA-binding FrmR family transcriptional regulator